MALDVISASEGSVGANIERSMSGCMLLGANRPHALPKLDASMLAVAVHKLYPRWSVLVEVFVICAAACPSCTKTGCVVLAFREKFTCAASENYIDIVVNHLFNYV